MGCFLLPYWCLGVGIRVWITVWAWVSGDVGILCAAHFGHVNGDVCVAYKYWFLVEAVLLVSHK